MVKRFNLWITLAIGITSINILATEKSDALITHTPDASTNQTLHSSQIMPNYQKGKAPMENLLQEMLISILPFLSIEEASHITLLSKKTRERFGSILRGLGFKRKSFTEYLPHFKELISKPHPNLDAGFVLALSNHFQDHSQNLLDKEVNLTNRI